MCNRLFAFEGALAVAVMAVLLVPFPAAAQSGLTAVEKAAAALAPKGWTPPRTPDGQPDLQGIYTNGFITPVERPKELEGQAFFTKEEAVAFENHTGKANYKDTREGGNLADVEKAYNDVWWDYGTKLSKTLQTSLVVDPPDGRVPPLTPEAQKRKAIQAQAVMEKCSQPGSACAVNIYGPPTPADGPEDRGYTERCYAWPQGGPPMMPSGYNNNYQIVQTPNFVTVFVESMHEARVIPLDGRPHLPPNVRQLMGDPRGRWEGNTLVVDSTNFSADTKFRNMNSPNMHLVERFTRTDPDTVLYEYTVDDPSNYAKPWSAAITLAATKGPIFEYSCNEGNHGMVGILSGARAAEKKLAEEAAAAKAR
jgi:hypothetical protein